jgi:hypothetical protein
MTDDPTQAGEQPVDNWTPTERISWFPVPAEEDLDPRVAELVALQRQKGPSGLSRVEREMIGVVVSAENRCML